MSFYPPRVCGAGSEIPGGACWTDQGRRCRRPGVGHRGDGGRRV